jgi:transposase
MTLPDPCRDFFLQPHLARHRRYELLRARFVDGLRVKEIAQRFGLSAQSVESQIRDFKRALDEGRPMAFFLELSPGPKTDRKKPVAREHIVRLRARGYADTDIHTALKRAGIAASVALIDQVLREEGLAPMRKRSREDRERIARELESGKIPGLTIPAPATPRLPLVADARRLDLQPGPALHSRVAGIFLFIPFLVQLGLDKIVEKAGLVGTKMIPAVSYLLSMLALKLLDKERKSHISDWNFDEALGRFAGLNVLPKTTAATDYSYRLADDQPSRLLVEWVRQAYPILCPQGAGAFALDFHAIAHRGQPEALENHYVPMRGKAIPSVQTFFARAVDSPMLCFAQADIVRGEQSRMPLRFIESWKEITGLAPDWLYFDSRLTTYDVLDELRQQNIDFITIRRRGQSLIRHLREQPANRWTPAVIDTPQRRHQHVRLLEQHVRLKDYGVPCRQVAADGLGRATPTLFLTNNEQETGRAILCRYIQRNAIENDLGINVNFFHLNCLASEVRLNVNTDVVLTVLANGCYRWLSQQLKGCERLEPKMLYRKFVETAGTVHVSGEDLVVNLERRSHNPILAQARLDQNAQPIPWLAGKRLRFHFA